jgi:hypothetical protein
VKEGEMQHSMNAEIRKRMESPKWDLEISQNVLSRVKKTRKRRLMAASITSLAAVALLLISLIFNTGGKTGIPEFKQFISAQVDGTYSEVFVARHVESASNDISYRRILSDPIDELIDNTLSMR